MITPRSDAIFIRPATPQDLCHLDEVTTVEEVIAAVNTALDGAVDTPG